MPLWKAALARSKPNSCTKLVIHPGMLPGVTCLPTSKDITIASGCILPSGISPPMRQNAAPRNPVSTKSGEGHIVCHDVTDHPRYQGWTVHNRLERAIGIRVDGEPCLV